MPRSVISSRMKGQSVSATAALGEMLNRLRREGRDVVDLAQGEVEDIGPPESVREAAYAAIRDDRGKYTPVGGLPELREAIASWFSRRGVLAGRSEVLATPGAKHAIFTFFSAVLESGDEVIVPLPYWTSFPDQIRLAGGVPRLMPTRAEDSYKVTPDRLLDLLTSRTRVLILNNPNNPSGAVYARSELESLLGVIRRRDLLVLADEVYSELTYEGVRHQPFAALGEEAAAVTVTVNAASKTYCMTGWRLGFAAGPREIIATMEQIQSHTTSCPNSIAQWGVLNTLQADDDAPVEDLRRRLSERRRFILEGLGGLPEMPGLAPMGGFYIFPSVAPLLARLGLPDAAALVPRLLDATGVLTAPGTAFGIPDHLRLCFGASSRSLKRAVPAIAGWVAGTRSEQAAVIE